MSVIVATYRRDDDLVQTIRSILSQPDKFELVVVDQTASHSMATQAFLEQVEDPRFAYHRVQPPSLTAARNYGIGKSSGDVVIFVDDDVELHDGFVPAHAEAYEDEAVGAVAGRVIGSTEPPGGRLAYLSRSGFREGSFDQTQDAEATLVRGCNMSFRRSVLDQIGGFDSRIIGNAIFEDFDAAYRVRKAGWRVVYRSKAALDHFDTTSGGCHDEVFYGHDPTFFRNIIRFFIKHRLFGRLTAYCLIRTGSSALRRDWAHFRALTVGFGRGVASFFLAPPSPSSPL